MELKAQDVRELFLYAVRQATEDQALSVQATSDVLAEYNEAFNRWLAGDPSRGWTEDADGNAVYLEAGDTMELVGSYWNETSYAHEGMRVEVTMVDSDGDPWFRDSDYYASKASEDRGFRKVN